MVNQSGTNARFLNTPVILSEVMRVMEPTLAFLDLIPFVDTGGQPVVIGIKNSKALDGKKQTPRTITPMSKFPEVQISRMTKDTAITTAQGLSIKFDSSALKLPAGKDMIMDGLESVAYWLAEELNSRIYSTLDAGSTDSGITVGGAWSEGTSTPMKDLLGFKNSMKREGYPYRMTDMFVDQTNLNELEGFLSGSEYPAFRDAVMTSTLQDSIVLPMEGRPTIHGLASGITHGDILGMDRVHKTAASVYYHNDPDFNTPAAISYETVVDGKSVMKTVPNFGLNSHQYFDDEEHVTVVQVWTDNVVKVKDAYGLISENGI